MPRPARLPQIVNKVNCCRISKPQCHETLGQLSCGRRKCVTQPADKRGTIDQENVVDQENVNAHRPFA